MYKQFAKLEMKINQLLVLIGDKIVWLLKMLVPGFIVQKILNTKQAIINFFKRMIAYLGMKVTLTGAWLKLKITQTRVVINKLLSFPIKNKAIDKLGKVEEFFKTTPARKYAGMFHTWITPAIEKWKSFVNGITPKQTVMFITLCSLLIVAGLHIYTNSAKIIDEQFPDRKPAQFYEYIDRPSYYNMEKKIAKVQNVKIPMQILSVNDVKNVVIDFSMTCSNRFTKKFLEEHEFQLRDHLFVNFQPMDPSFTFDEEGKWLLKEKIKDEVNIFLEKKRVEGKVVEVHLLDLLGT